MGFVIVEFSERREVFCGGDSQGFNKEDTGEDRKLRIGDGKQTFWLAEPLDYDPPRVTIVVDGNVIEPQRVVFTKKA